MPVITRYSLTVSAGLGSAALFAAGLLVGTSASLITATPAAAQGFLFWEQPAKPRKIRRARPPRETDDADPAAKTAAPDKQASGPLVLNVSLKNQRVYIYDQHGLVTESPISSGRVGYATPTGVFSILEKNRVHHSNLYGGAPMPNMQRITWSGVALHAGALPGYPASHGCIRLPHGFSKKLFGMTKMGTRVVVTREASEPLAIEHDKLFAGYPSAAPISTGAIAQPALKMADASNAGGTLSAVVATAAADPAPAAPMKSAYREKREREMLELSAAVRAAGYEKLEMQGRVAPATTAAEETRAAYAAAKATVQGVLDEARRTEAAKNATAQEFQAFAKRLLSARKMSESELAKAAAKEDALEAKAFEAATTHENAAKAAADAQVTLAPLETAMIGAEQTRKAAINDLAAAHAKLTAAVNAEEAAKRREAKRNLPVTVFISRAKNTLFVRQGYEPIFDVPVTFDSPDQMIGTHVFTALDFVGGKPAMKWSVLSVPTPSGTRTEPRKTRRGQKPDPQPVAVDDARLPQTAAAALDRVTISAEAREQIEDVMKPGSSLIISDYGIGNETGKFTDFIVQTR